MLTLETMALHFIFVLLFLFSHPCFSIKCHVTTVGGISEQEDEVCLGKFDDSEPQNATRLASFTGYDYFRLGCFSHNKITLCACNNTDFCSDQIQNQQVKKTFQLPCFSNKIFFGNPKILESRKNSKRLQNSKLRI